MNNHELNTSPREETTEKHPLEDMPSFEEHMRGMQAEEPPKEVQKEVASGELSKLFLIEKPDGTKSARLESDYFDMATDFAKDHQAALKENPDLRIAMSGLSNDLALIDATNGRNYESGDDAIRKSLLDDYSKLQSKLDDDNTSPEEKQLITDYLNTMDGKSLSFIKEKYDETKSDSMDGEQSEEKAKFAQAIEEVRNNLTRAKDEFSESDVQFDSALNHIAELMNHRSMDEDALYQGYNALRRAEEELEMTLNNFRKKNSELLNISVHGEKNSLYADDEGFEKDTLLGVENDEMSKKAALKLFNLDDQLASIKKYINSIEELNQKFRSF